MLEFKYDTQLLIEGEDLDEDVISDYFTEHFKGDCLLAVGDEELIKIHEILENREIAVFSLDSLRYPEQAREFGRLIINDLKANIAEHMKRRGGQRGAAARAALRDACRLVLIEGQAAPAPEALRRGGKRASAVPLP